MHIAFVLEDFTLGGVERVSEKLISALNNHYGYTITIICEYDQGDLKDTFHQLGPVFTLGGRSRLLRFKNICAQLQPDLVVFTKGGLSRYGLMLSSSTPKVAVQHVPINLPDQSAFKNLFRRVGASILFRTLDKVICVSEGILNNLQQLKVIGADKGLCIYNPVLDQHIKKLAAEDVEYEDYFVCVGRLHFQKGYDLLIKAVTQAKQATPSLKVIIIGNGPDERKLKHQIAQSDLADTILLHGTTDNPYKYIAHAKGILLPSRWEGMPTVLVEAAYLDTPIVAFDCRYGPKELTGRGQLGYLVEFLDVDTFAEKIVALELNKAPKLPSPNVDCFSLEAAASHYHNLFKSLL